MSETEPEQIDITVVEENLNHCPVCGTNSSDTEFHSVENKLRCGNCLTKAVIEEETVHEVLEKVSIEAAEHGADYAAGMRNGRSIVEQELLEKFR